jgi:hypothetical protein
MRESLHSLTGPCRRHSRGPRCPSAASTSALTCQRNRCDGLATPADHRYLGSRPSARASRAMMPPCLMARDAGAKDALGAESGAYLPITPAEMAI